ncbi:MAG: TIGR00730 family Rossman fold protein [Gammaproteobacteria bacterium]|jgi:uncharacterized protein (TIGR00730 family)|nr:TIGR00730 family Rossman fold protein [Gammaproteobacteria bacterium]MBT6042033.1 TIGR00730 family Rossman fold protein [Gammaproteobacteria bacterium]
MSKRKQPGHLFHSAADERRFANPENNGLENEQLNSPAYRLAFDDMDFLLRDEMRPVRFLLELSKPEILLTEHGVNHSVVMFGSARTCDMEQAISNRDAARQALENDSDNSSLGEAYAKAEAAIRHAEYYEQARELASLVSARSGCDDCPKLHVITGGGPGVMEAANRGASEVGSESVGLNIVLPHEQQPNPYITPELCFQFHYFAMRKMHFMLRARALVAFPGGFGTMDELFETLTLIQTGKIKHLPVLLFGKDYWQKLINFDLLVEEGMINREDLSIFQFVDDVERAWDIIRESLEVD